MPPVLALYAKQFLEIKLFTFYYLENKRLTSTDVFIRPKVHFMVVLSDGVGYVLT